MKEPKYSVALWRAWQLTWHHKDLWVFGLFAAFLGQMGLVEILSQSTLAVMNINNPSGFLFVWYVVQDFLLTFSAFSFGAVDYIGALWLLLLLGILGIGLLYISVVSQGALVHSAARYAHERRKKMHDLHLSWHVARERFWALLSLNILRKAVVITIASFVAWATVNAVWYGSFGDQMLYLFIFVLAVVVGMVASVWFFYATGYVVVEQYKLLPALRTGWRLFTMHWLVSFEIGFLCIIFNIVLLFILLIALFFFFLPTFFLWSLSVSLGGSILLISVGLTISIILFCLFTVFVGTLFNAFVTSTWAYLFSKMHKHGLVSHVVDLFHGRRI